MTDHIDRARFFDLSLDLLCIASAEGYFLDLNPRWSAVLGWTTEELSSKPFLEFVHPDDLQATIDETVKLQGGQDTISFQNRYLCKDGSYRWLRWTSSYLDGNYWAVARDFTAEREAQVALHESERRFRRAFEEDPTGLCVLDASLHVRETNAAFTRLVGRPHADLLGVAFPDLLIERPGVKLERLVAGLHAESPSLSEEISLACPDGPPVAARLTAAPLDLGEEATVLVLVEDVSERQEAQEALAEANEKLESWVTQLEVRNHEVTLINEMGDLLQSCRTADELHEVLSKFSRRLFPGASGAIGLISNSRSSVEVVASWGDLPGRTVFAPDDCWALRRGRSHQVEDPNVGMVCPHVEGEAAVLCLPMMAQGEALGLLTISQVAAPSFVRSRSLTEISMLATTFAEHIALALANFKLRESLRDQSIRDPLTGLFNRRYVDETLDRELARAQRSGSALSLIALDLDHFKRMNDTVGHDGGDRILKDVAKVLKGSLRHADIAARMGGEEFLLVLVDSTIDVAQKRAEQIAMELRNLDITIRGTPAPPVTASMGVSAFPEHGAGAEDLRVRADDALYRAKEAGRDRVILARDLESDHESAVDGTG